MEDTMRRKNQAAVELGALGGKARAKNLTKPELQAIARLGAAATNKARWGTAKGERAEAEAARLEALRTGRKWVIKANGKRGWVCVVADCHEPEAMPGGRFCSRHQAIAAKGGKAKAAKRRAK
jgi:hypothetical protein